MKLNELHNSYLKALTMISPSKTDNRKFEAEKKDDELTAHQLKYSIAAEGKSAIKAFPITVNMFTLSFLMWLSIGVLIYYIVTYGSIYTRIKQEQDLYGPCKDSFYEGKEKNMRKLENYTEGDAAAYLARLKFKQDQADYPMESKTLPPVVTAVTSDHFYNIQGLIQHIIEAIRPNQSDLKLIVYDLGLSTKQRKLMNKYCYCEMRDLDYDSFPRHVSSYSTYAWRPIILQLLLHEFGAVVYIDPTTRFKSPSSLNFLRMRGSRSFFVWDYIKFTPLIAYTEKATFRSLKEDRCTFKECSLLSPEAIVLYRTANTWNEVVKPWLKCALNVNCISPRNALYKGCFELRQPRTTGCHRYDMSALSIILNRGSQYTLGTEHMVSFRLTYTTHEEVEYFPEQLWTYRKLLFLILAPVFAVLLFKYVYRRRGRFRLCQIR